MNFNIFKPYEKATFKAILIQIIYLYIEFFYFIE